MVVHLLASKTVEVNSTYYGIPPMVLVEGRRRRVQKDFELPSGAVESELRNMLVLEDL